MILEKIFNKIEKNNMEIENKKVELNLLANEGIKLYKELQEEIKKDKKENRYGFSKL
ncbi:MAG: hypothetical protein ACRC7N_00695 [Clostridium sp.]